MFLLNPNQTSSAADQVPPSLSAIARQNQITMIENELTPRMKKSEPSVVQSVSKTIVKECEVSGLDPLFILAIIESESGFDPEAVSAVVDRNGNPKANAKGMMQLLPSTAKEMGVTKIFDPVDNVRGGIRYVRHLWDRGFGRKGGAESILLAYNQGPKTAISVLRGEVERPAEAQAFVPRVMARYRHLLTKNGKNPKDAKKLFLVAR